MKFVSLATFLSGALAVAVLALADTVRGGPAFVEEGVPIIWILTLGIIVRSSVGAAESVLTMSGEQKACAIVYAATLMFNLILNWQLIPVYGLNGAAMATTGALFFEAFALYAAARRRLSLHIFILPMRSGKPQARPAE